MTPRETLRKHIDGQKQFEVARKLGVAGATLSLWLSGKRRPTHPYRIAIETFTRGAVPASAWETAKERRVAARGKAA